jgi:lipopolysaccharide biosynthesis protein
VAERDGIELVCKVHGKRSPHVATGEAWRRDMLEKLLGSEAAVSAVIDAFRADPRLGIVGPGGHVVPSSYYWERNAARVGSLCARMGFDVKGVDFSYVAGSMFWARVAALAPLRRLELSPADFDAEPAPVDGTVAHALERCFPIAARVAGMRVGETANPAGTTVRDFAP